MRAHITRADLYRNGYGTYAEAFCLCGWRTAFRSTRPLRKVWREINRWADHHETLNAKEKR